jgi:glycosyltransferase involved in cell wall biosynthesis
VVVGFVGRLCREKGINELVGAFGALAKDHPKLYLLLVGPQEDVQAKYEERIIITDYQERPEEHLAAMDIFALPSYREGFGIVNIEASAMELPVISTDIPGPRDSVLDGKTGILVQVRSRIALQEAMARLLGDPQLRRQMGQAGREWARTFEQHRLWEKIVEHRLSLLQKSGVRI